MASITLWVKINKGKYVIDSPYNKAKELEFRKEREGKLIKWVMSDRKKPKSEEALGYYWGGIIPSILAQDKGLVHRGQINGNPLILGDLVKRKAITADEIEGMHRRIMLSFRPRRVVDIRTGRSSMVGDEMKHYNNEKLCLLINEVLDWAESEGGYEMPDNEVYKKIRDSALPA